MEGFIGGNFILGGLTLGNEDYIKLGLTYTHGFHHTYASDSPRIGPEIFAWVPAGCPPIPTVYVPATDPGSRANYWDPRRYGWVIKRQETPKACKIAPGFYHQADFYNKNGFFVENSGYHLRPEVLELYYYAYRATGDPMYQDWAWDAFLAINATARAGTGFTNFHGINSGWYIQWTDHQESFWFAKTLKYLYIIFAEQDAEWQVNAKGCGGREGWVFNTEAHPLRVRNAMPSRKT